MRIHNQKELLEFWEQVHGKLKEELKKAVINNSTITQILTFDSDHIKVAIKRNAELNDVLRDLQDQTKRKEFHADGRDMTQDEPVMLRGFE